MEGQGNLEKFLINNIAFQIEEIASIGIIQDADSDFETSLKSIKEAIEKAQLDKSKIKIFLTPNNQDRGDLETLLLSTIESSAILECFDGYSACLQKDNEIYPKALNKGKLHAYTMYSQKGENLYKPMQSFIHQNKDTNLWNIDHPNFQPIVDFVKQIFKDQR